MLEPNRLSACIALAVAGSAATVTLAAQSDSLLEEVVVTAQRRTEDLQKVSASITNVSGEQISEGGLANLEDILKNVPGVVVQGSARGQLVSIRGIGNDMPPQFGEGAVAMSFDGVYDFRSESGSFGYFDVDRVEVLRGPQGTLYGRNATAGAVNVISRAPTQELSARVSAEAGNYDLRRLEGAINVPLSSEWASRLAFVTIDRDGYQTNGSNDLAGTAVRGRLLFEPREDVRLLLNAEYFALGGHGPGLILDSAFDAGRPEIGIQPDTTRRKYIGARYSAELSLEVGPGTLQVIPAYDRASGYNYSGCNVPVQLTNDFSLCKANDPAKATQTQTEIRYVSRPESRVAWVAGAFYVDQSNAGDFFGFPNALENTTESHAVFGQVTFPVTDAVSIVAGARETWDEKGYIQSAPVFSSGSEETTSFDWKAGLEYHPSPTSMLYGTVATSHRAGGFNLFSGGTTFEPEKVLNYELGSKNRFFGNRLQLNGAVYYLDYQDYQATDFVLDPGPPVSFQVNFLNVEKVRSYGAELEAVALIGDHGTFNLSANYLHSRYASSFIVHDPPPFVQLDGAVLPHSPDFSGNVGYTHRWDLPDAGTLSATGSLRYTGDQYVAVSPVPRNFQKAFTTGDVSLMYTSPSKKWSVNAYVKNVNDKIVRTGHFDNTVVGPPRTYGVVVSADFL